MPPAGPPDGGRARKTVYMTGVDASPPGSEFSVADRHRHRPPGPRLVTRGRPALPRLRRADRHAAPRRPRTLLAEVPGEERVALVDTRFVGHVHALRLGLTDPRFPLSAIPGAVTAQRSGRQALTRAMARENSASGQGSRQRHPRGGPPGPGHRSPRHRRAPPRARQPGRRRARRPAGPQRGAAGRRRRGRGGRTPQVRRQGPRRLLHHLLRQPLLAPSRALVRPPRTDPEPGHHRLPAHRADRGRLRRHRHPRGIRRRRRAAPRLVRPGLRRRPARPLLAPVLHARRLARRHVRPGQGVCLLPSASPSARPVPATTSGPWRSAP